MTEAEHDVIQARIDMIKAARAGAARLRSICPKLYRYQCQQLEHAAGVSESAIGMINPAFDFDALRRETGFDIENLPPRQRRSA